MLTQGQRILILILLCTGTARMMPTYWASPDASKGFLPQREEVIKRHQAREVHQHPSPWVTSWPHPVILAPVTGHRACGSEQASDDSSLIAPDRSLWRIGLLLHVSLAEGQVVLPSLL